MQKTADILKEFEISFEMKVLSAHRLPAHVAEFASNAKDNGYQVLIGGAGMAAHLAGALASHSTLPVIGVPLSSKSSPDGMDALLSTVQMPKGIPVATVAVDGAANAAYLAIQILSLQDSEIGKKYENYRKSQAEKLLSEG